MRKLLTALIFVTSSSFLGAVAERSHAQPSPLSTAYGLYKLCLEPIGTGDKAICLGYFAGFDDAESDTRDLSLGRRIYCVVPNVSVEETVMIFEKYARDHPQELHFLPRQMVAFALAEAFPCPRS